VVRKYELIDTEPQLGPSSDLAIERLMVAQRLRNVIIYVFK